MTKNNDLLPVPNYAPILVELDALKADVARLSKRVRRLETVTLRQMHALGIKDQEIADELGGISSQAVNKKRRRHL